LREATRSIGSSGDPFQNRFFESSGQTRHFRSGPSSTRAAVCYSRSRPQARGAIVELCSRVYADA